MPGPSGSSRRLTEYLKALPDRFSVVVLSAKTPDHSHIEKYQGARLLRVPVGSGDLASRIQAFERAVRRQLESEEYALAHFTDPFGGYALCELKGDYGYRLIYEAQTFPSQELRYTHPQTEGDRRFLSKIRRQELFCLMNADLIVTGSQTTRSYIQSLGASEELVRVLRAPVDLAPFSPDVMGAPDGEPLRLMYLGSHVGWQGLPTLLRAVALANEQVEAKLTLVGAQHPDWQPHLDELVKELGLTDRVEFQAPVHHDDVAKVLALADVGVLALDDVERNRVQGGPLAKVSEYCAAGRPILAADLPVCRELVPDDVAVFFPPGNSRAMADRIIELARDVPRRIEMGTRAREHAEAALDASSIRGQLLDLYDSLLEKRTGPVTSTREDDLPMPTMVTGTPTNRLAMLLPPDSGRVKIPQVEKRETVAQHVAPPPEAAAEEPPVVMGMVLEDGFDTRLVKTEPDARPVEPPVVMGLPLRERASSAASSSARGATASPPEETTPPEASSAIAPDPTPVTPIRAAQPESREDTDAASDDSGEDARQASAGEHGARSRRSTPPMLGDEPPAPTPVEPPAPTPIIRMPASLLPDEPPSPTPIIRAPVALQGEEPPAPTPIIRAPASLQRDDAPMSNGRGSLSARRDDEVQAPTPIVPMRSVLASRSTSARVETPSRRMSSLGVLSKSAQSNEGERGGARTEAPRESKRPSGRTRTVSGTEARTGSAVEAEKSSGHGGTGAESEGGAGRAGVTTDAEKTGSTSETERSLARSSVTADTEPRAGRTSTTPEPELLSERSADAEPVAERTGAAPEPELLPGHGEPSSVGDTKQRSEKAHPEPEHSAAGTVEVSTGRTGTSSKSEREVEEDGASKETGTASTSESESGRVDAAPESEHSTNGAVSTAEAESQAGRADGRIIADHEEGHSPRRSDAPQTESQSGHVGGDSDEEQSTKGIGITAEAASQSGRSDAEHAPPRSAPPQTDAQSGHVGGDSDEEQSTKGIGIAAEAASQSGRSDAEHAPPRSDATAKTATQPEHIGGDEDNEQSTKSVDATSETDPKAERLGADLDEEQAPSRSGTAPEKESQAGRVGALAEVKSLSGRASPLSESDRHTGNAPASSNEDSASGHRRPSADEAPASAHDTTPETSDVPESEQHLDSEEAPDPELVSEGSPSVPESRRHTARTGTVSNEAASSSTADTSPSSGSSASTVEAEPASAHIDTSPVEERAPSRRTVFDFAPRSRTTPPIVEHERPRGDTDRLPPLSRSSTPRGATSESERTPPILSESSRAPASRGASSEPERAPPILTESGRGSAPRGTSSEPERAPPVLTGSSRRASSEPERPPPLLTESPRATPSRGSTSVPERPPPILTPGSATKPERPSSPDAERGPPVLRPHATESERPPALPPRASAPPPVPRQRPPRLMSIDGPPRLEPIEASPSRPGPLNVKSAEPEDEPEEISEDEAQAIEEGDEDGATPPHARPRLDEPDEISSDEVEEAEVSVSSAARLIEDEDLQEAEADEAIAEPPPEDEAPAPEPLPSMLNPWFAQLAHGYCPPEGTRFARHTPPTTFPGRDDDTDPSRLPPSPPAQGVVRGKGQ
ncbi:glycosyltransferase [Myxococcus stipitatus]|uniref:glycosyltransferase n=1 Tax=Myxococcus stipitatus TaxID=83455 RepID=UPI003CD00B5E